MKTKTETTFKPILFSYEMAKANKELRKTETRRDHNLQEINQNPDNWFITNADIDTFVLTNMNVSLEVKSKYSPGDVLWIKETTAEIDVWPFVVYRSDFERQEKKREINVRNWTPSLLMTAEKCRQWAVITSVSLERICSISENECIAEGIHQDEDYKGFAHYDKKKIIFNHYDSPKDSFISLWESLRGKGSFKQNKWVFAYKYEVISEPCEWKAYLREINNRKN